MAARVTRLSSMCHQNGCIFCLNQNSQNLQDFQNFGNFFLSTIGEYAMRNKFSKNRIFCSLFPILATITALVMGCATLPQSTLMPQGKNERLLPPLTPVIDMQSFGSVFGIATTQGTSSGMVYGGTYSGGIIGVNNSTTYSSVVLNDINTIFGRDIENISVPIYSGKAKGTIIARLASGEIINLHWWPMLLSCFSTACIINLFGVPIDYATAGLQIEVTILNDKNGVVGKYVSNYHEQKSYYAMYWGYNPGGAYNNPSNDAQKRNARLVFAECMKDIKQQIANDYDRLNSALNEEGYSNEQR